MDEDWISITDAADRLTKAGDLVTRSTLSRYLDKHGDALPTKRVGRSNMVDYVRLRQHRQENVRLAFQASAPISNSVRHVSESRNASSFEGTKVNGAARKALADAELKEMDLAERRKLLTPTAEVDQAGRDAIALMRSAFERAVESEAATLSVRYGWDERVIRLALKGFARVGLDVFHREILKHLDNFQRQSDAASLDGAPTGREAVADLLQ